jgi:peptidoglycan/LPS O-acetylase OafA/YrhL
MPVEGSPRIAELDSVRGLAALTVLLGHLAMVHGLGDVAYRVVSGAGRAAVVVFFVLSGFVLSLPFYRRHVDYGAFVVRRIFRIYPPYLVAVLGALGLSTALSPRPISGLGLWFNGQWATSPSPESLISHISLIWSFPKHHSELDLPLWSLVYEMRISLIFPLLVGMVFWFGWRKAIVFLPLVSIAGLVGGKVANHFGTNDWFGTVRYTPAFVVGIVLAGNSPAITLWFRRLPSMVRLLWLPGLLALWAIPVVVYRSHAVLRDWADCLIATMLIVLVLASPAVQKLMRVSPLVLLGRISYSLYLLHVVVILGLVHGLYGYAPLSLILVLAAVASILVAWISYYCVEVPSIKLGRRLSGAPSVRKGLVTTTGAEATPP